MPTATEPTTGSEIVVAQPREIVQIRTDLEKRADDLLTVLPPGMDVQRFIRVSLMAISKNPDLMQCSRASLITSIVEAAEVGLEPTGGIGGAWLVPFRQKDGPKVARLILDYRGVQFLIRQGGGGEVETTLVYEGDYFKVFKGTNPRIEHEPAFQTIDPTKITYVYAVALDSGKFEVMTKEDIDRIRARAPGANSGPWVTDYGAQSRKTVLKRISAWLPLKPAIRERLERDTEREIAESPSERVATQSRAQAVRDRLRARRASVEEPDAVPPDSAGQQTDATSQEGPQRRRKGRAGKKEQEAAPTTEAPAQATVQAVCGAGSDPAFGDVEVCVLEPDHKSADGTLSPHKAESGSTWPNRP